jgi:hypothetical protein
MAAKIESVENAQRNGENNRRNRSIMAASKAESGIWLSAAKIIGWRKAAAGGNGINGGIINQKAAENVNIGSAAAKMAKGKTAAMLAALGISKQLARSASRRVAAANGAARCAAWQKRRDV